MDCEENNSDIDDVDFVISVEEDNERPENNEDTQQQFEAHPELDVSAIDLPDDELIHDISAMGMSEVQSKISATNPRQREIITEKRKVCSIDTSLDPAQYNAFELPNNEQRCRANISKKMKTNPERNILWSKLPPSNHKTSVKNIIKHRLGPDVKPDVSNAITPILAWNVFFTKVMISDIVKSTNAKVKPMVDSVKNNSKFYYIKYTDSDEVLAFIGLCYMRGVLGINHYNYSLLFNDIVGPPIFVSAMSANRFSFLHANICFDNISTRKDRYPFDKFAAMREIFEAFNRNCGLALNPSDYLSLDDTLYPCHNKISFKQYNPNMPAKCGILYRSINSARFPYTYQTAVYCGKPENTPAPYYIQGALPIVKMLVEDLEKYSDLEGVNITMDRQYTSIELCEWLLQKHITTLGTTMANREGIPVQMSSVAHRKEFSYRVMWENTNKKLSLHSYVVNTKSKGKKNVLALTTLVPLLATTIDDNKNEPAILKLYEFTKGGAVIADQRIRTYTTNTGAKRWTMSVFSYLLDTARVNSQTLWALNKNRNPKLTNSFQFALQLATDLVYAHINIRNTKYLATATRKKIETFLKVNKHVLTSAVAATTLTKTTPESSAATAVQVAAAETATLITETLEPAAAATTLTVKKRCIKCIEFISSLDVTERKKGFANMNRISTACKMCKKIVCKLHFYTICQNCSQNWTLEPAAAAKTLTVKKRCIKCIEIISSLHVTKRKKMFGNMNRVSTVCKMCAKTVCKLHFYTICQNCYQNIN